MSIYSEIKKYLLYLIGFFCIVLVGHLVVLYTYSDATQYPLPGGTINIGIVGETPTLDILSTDLSTSNNDSDTITHFLYRGLARYSTRDKKITGDLGKCSLETFPSVKCTLSSDTTWSDGTPVSTDDVVASYKYFQENAKNEYTKLRLSKVQVKSEEDEILINFSTRDVTFLDALFLPILRQSDIEAKIETITTHVTTNGGYMFESFDEQKNAFLLKRNPYYKYPQLPAYADQVRFVFAKTEDDFSITPDVTFSTTKLHSGSQETRFVRPILYSAFLNTNRIPEILRTALLFDILSKIEVPEDTIMPEENVFLGEIPNIARKSDQEFFTLAANNLGYSLGGKVIVPPKPTGTPLKYIASPGNTTPLFRTNNSFDISGSVPAGTTRVVINEYTLRDFAPGNPSFVYRVRPNFKNITTGENTYKVTFYKGSNSLATESLLVHFNSDQTALNEAKKQWEVANTPPPPAPDATLDPTKLYKQGVQLSFQLLVQSDIPVFLRTAETIQNELRKKGAEVNISVLPYEELRNSIQSNNYDIALVGTDLGLFYYNIAPLFHSSHAGKGSNYSQYKNSQLDTLVTKLSERLYQNDPDRLRALEIEIQDILEQRSLIYTIGSPYEYITVKDGVIDGMDLPTFLPGRELIYETIARSYFKVGYKQSDTTKSPLGFVEWLSHALFSSNT